MKHISKILLCVILLSCNKSQKNDISKKADTRNDVWPLNIGNTWTFNLTVFNMDGTQRSQSKYTQEITNQRNIEGMLWYELDHGPSYVRVINYDLVEILDSTDSTIKKWFKKVDQIETLEKSTNRYGYTKYVIAYPAIEDIKGFSCTHTISFTIDPKGDTSSKTIVYFTKGIGPVKTIDYYNSNITGKLIKSSESFLETYFIQ